MAFNADGQAEPETHGNVMKNYLLLTLFLFVTVITGCDATKVAFILRDSIKENLENYEYLVETPNDSTPGEIYIFINISKHSDAIFTSEENLKIICENICNKINSEKIFKNKHTLVIEFKLPKERSYRYNGSIN